MVPQLSDENQARFGWDEKSVASACRTFDVITAPRWRVHLSGVGHKTMTNYEFYTRDHYQKDIDNALTVIKHLSPDVYPYIMRYMFGYQCSFANIAIMRSDLFDSYADWLFTVLTECERTTDISAYDAYQRRIWGFIAERLCGGYADFLASTRGARVGSLELIQGVFDEPTQSSSQVNHNIRMQRKTAVEIASPATICVALSTDDNYAPHCGAALASILSNISPLQSISVYIVHDASLDDNNIRRLSSIATQQTHVVNFIRLDRNAVAFLPNTGEQASIVKYCRLALH